MTATLLDGKAPAQALKNTVADAIKLRLQKGQLAPGLAVILVGDDPASEFYIKHKQKACAEVGMLSVLHQLPTNATIDDIIETIELCDQDPTVNGILLQLPLPDPSMTHELIEHIDPLKDVDGFHPYNMGRLAIKDPFLRPCTPLGIIHMLNYYEIDLTGKHVVIVGASNIVGRPMALEALLEKATVTICHKETKNLQQHVEQADVLISATGKLGVIDSNWLQPNAIVIDIGFNRDTNGKTCGDIDFNSAKDKVAWITPVPGGVGQMTVATLLHNTLAATELQENILAEHS